MKNRHDRPEETTINRIFLVMALIWTFLAAIIVAMDIRQHQAAQYEVVLARARDTFFRDLIYRQWAAGHGGVYVPVTAETPPNPYLANIPERDLVTPSGRKLTLMNPAYMTRQVMEIGLRQFGLRGHITSLKPIRPENAPDEWEKKALEAFEGGKIEAASLESIEKETYLRFMRPLKVEQGCLKCHAQQGYVLGEIRGGISVSILWEPSRLALLAQRRATVLAYGSLWLVGLAMLGFARFRLLTNQLELRRAGETIRLALHENQSLLGELQHRAKNSFGMICSLIGLSSNADSPAETKAVLEELDLRVRSISELYSLLYSSGSFTEVRLDDYCARVASAMVGHSGAVSLITELESLVVPAKVAGPIGLIVTELVTNSFKYAFPDGKAGSIVVSLKKTEDGALIEVRDDGIGLPAGFDSSKNAGTGLNLVQELSAQVGGSFRMDGDATGTRCTVTFALAKFGK
jgi:two-component sensor histidine kinase